MMDDPPSRTIDLIELHDSVAELRRKTTSVVLHLRPAYVHHWENTDGGWKGVGRSQDARIEIGCRPDSVVAFGEIEVSDGSLRVGDSAFDMIPVPFEAVEPVAVHLELVDGTNVTITGSSVRAELVGPATDVEPLPLEWAPDVQ